MMNFSKSFSVGLYVLLVCGVVPSFAIREFEPVVVPAGNLGPWEPVPASAIVIYAYKSSSQSWHAVPFQIDEVPYFSDNDGIVDGDDEIVLLSQNFGYYAPPAAWIDDETSRKYPRYEIRIFDPVDFGVAYVYLFRTDDPGSHTKASGYMQYNSVDYSISSDYYSVGFNNNDLLDEVRIPASVGGTGDDILDRLKIRAVGTALGILPITLNEDHFERNANRHATPNPVVRVVKEWKFEIVIDLGGGEMRYDIPAYYLKFYPKMADFGGAKFKVPDTINPLDYFRFSLDLEGDNSGMIGMQMFSSISSNWLSFYPDSGGVPIDGTNDSNMSPRDLAPANKYHWWMQRGAGGTILMTTYIPDLPNTLERLYYKDATDRSNNDDVSTGDDTGDRESWGDTGVKFYQNMVPGTEIQIGGKVFFAGSNMTIKKANEITNLVEYPLQSEFSHSNFVPVELVAFTGSADRDRVRLTWQTASESNNLGFEVQRQVNNSGQWNKIGFVRGRGTTSDVQNYSFQDSPGVTGQVWYRLKQVDSDGTYEIFDPVTVNVRTPTRFVLNQNFPNPFNPSTVLSFEIPESADGITDLEIFDLLGRKVRSLWRQTAGAGYYRVEWDGRDDDGRITGSGVYIAVLSNGGFLITRKMVKLQ